MRINYELMQQIEDFVDYIPFEDLFNHIRAYFGIPDLEFTYELNIRGERAGVHITCTNISDYIKKIPLLDKIVKNIYIACEGYNFKDAEIVMDPRHGYLILRGYVRLIYDVADDEETFEDYIEGNARGGFTAFRFAYTEDDGWSF